jgi:ribosome recycling factor
VRRDANDKLKKMLKDTRSPKTTRSAASTRCRRSPTSTSAIDDLQKKKDGELLGK